MTQEQKERLGRIVREEWVKWAKEQPNPKPSWLVEWEGLSEPDKEVDRRIGARIWKEAIAAEREACAKIAEEELEQREATRKDPLYAGEITYSYGASMAAWEIAKKIRARSEGGEG